jgi:hypothetical protein
MTEGYTTGYAPPNGAQSQGFPGAQGPFVPTPVAPEPDDFSGDNVWKFTYNFGKYAKGRDVKGEVPTPSQARIDKYERDLTMLQVELEHAARQEQQAVQQAEAAQQGAGLSIEEARETVERAFAFKQQVMDKMRDALADFCGGHPTRKQFDLLPENALIAFNNALRRKLNPNS